jgi:hypothetical protein
VSSPVITIMTAITLVLAYAGGVLGVFCVVDALTRRPDAFAAADKQTKGTWVGITVACAAVLVLGILWPVFEPQTILWLAALVGSLVYLVDVRPKLREVSGPGRW